MVTCADAIEEAVKHYNGIITNSQIIEYLNTKFPEKPWQLNTIRAHLIGCTVNHSSSHHYKNFRKFLYSVDSGRVRLYNSVNDGIWIWTPNRMKKKDELADDSEPDDLEFDNDEITLSMEKDLESFLINDIGSLDSSLSLTSKIENRQITVPSGRIDILAKDKDGFVVIELKAGEAKDSSLTQLLAYMNDISSKSGSGNVKGILVAHEFSDKLIKASKLVPSILLKRYNVSFSFKAVIDEPSRCL